MDWVLIILRLIHIVGGVVWIAVALIFLGFLPLAVRDAGPRAGGLVVQKVYRGRLYRYLSPLVLLAIASGLILYWRASDGLNLDWIISGPGVGFTIGGLAAIGALVHGGLRLQAIDERTQEIARKIEISGEPASDEQLAELHSLQIALLDRVRPHLFLLAVALITMATARYWSF